jgi:MSHA biogenesis protein MshL
MSVTMSFRSQRAARISLAFAGALFATACASAAPTTQPQTSVRLEAPPQQTAPVSKPASNAPLPALPMSSTGTISDGGGRRIQALDANGQELSGVIRALAVQFGLQYQIDPAVRGIVNARLRNTTLSEALNTILPQGVTYELAAGVLRVSPARLETKIFSLDYVAISRFGTASTVIQRRLGGAGSGFGASGQGGGIGGAGGGAGGAGGFGGGADVISATSVANAWDDIRVAVEALVFETSVAAPTQAGNQAIPGGGGGGGGGQAFSRSTPDGRRLIINPMAGTIAVTSFPATLSQVESFIRTFETSIQRQVLIEAKIVEVNLERAFEFGIDWNVVANAGRIEFKNVPRSANAPAASSVELTLSGGPGKITSVLTALSTQGNVKVLSSPRVSALNNQRAVFNVTTQEIFFTSSTVVTGAGTGSAITQSSVTPTPVNVGIVLDVLAQIGADNSVTMNIRPVVTSVARTAEFIQNDGTTFRAPVIDTRESDTMARMRAGETIIIGGLMQTRSERVRSGVPVLSSIPLLGRLFTRYSDVERKAELVIFLTPTIIAGHPPTAQ